MIGIYRTSLLGRGVRDLAYPDWSTYTVRTLNMHRVFAFFNFHEPLDDDGTTLWTAAFFPWFCMYMYIRDTTGKMMFVARDGSQCKGNDIDLL